VLVDVLGVTYKFIVISIIDLWNSLARRFDIRFMGCCCCSPNTALTGGECARK
jgi:hypothetical protein